MRVVYPIGSRESTQLQDNVRLTHVAVVYNVLKCVPLTVNAVQSRPNPAHLLEEFGMSQLIVGKLTVTIIDIGRCRVCDEFVEFGWVIVHVVSVGVMLGISDIS